MKIVLTHDEMYPVPSYNTDFKLVEQHECIRDVPEMVIAEYDAAYVRFCNACAALEAAYKAAYRPTEKVVGRMSSARFTVSCGASETRWIIDDDDFGYDARLVITGDFVGEAGMSYAKAVAAALNAAGIPTKREQEKSP